MAIYYFVNCIIFALFLSKVSLISNTSKASKIKHLKSIN